MAIYYLDPINGNDSSDGLSVINAWLTYAYTRQQVTAGDTIYILPGVSNEQVTMLYSGTDGNPIEWIGCPNGIDNKTGTIIIDRKGSCIITAFDNTGVIVNTNAGITYNSKNYNNIYGLEIYHITTYGIYVSGNNSNIYNCKAYNYGKGYCFSCVTNSQATNSNTINNCYSYGAAVGISYFNKVIKCISYNYQNAIPGNQNVICSYGKSPLLSFGTSSSAVNNIYLNNTADGSQNGFYYNTQNLNTNTFYNNISINCFNGINIAIAGNYMASFYNHYIINCSVPFTNIIGNTTTLDINGIYYQRYSTLNSGVRYTGTANLLASPYWLNNSDRNKIFPITQNQTIDNTHTLESFGVTTDLENQPLDLIDGIRKVGAIQQSLLSFIDEGIQGTDYYETKNTIKIHRRGIFKKTIRLNKGIHIISAWLRYDLQGGTNRPQLLIRDSENNKLVNNSDTTVSSGTGFRYIETSFTVKQDGEIVFMFFNQESNVNSYCIISDLKII